jgi:DNA (cytosine-5)-methyltransferase 1
LTAHEAARLQFFPDFFDFTPAQSRTKLAEIIGNAVPPKGAYAVARSIIQNLELTK